MADSVETIAKVKLALERCGGNRTQAAEMLGWQPARMYAFLRRNPDIRDYADNPKPLSVPPVETLAPAAEKAKHTLKNLELEAEVLREVAKASGMTPGAIELAIGARNMEQLRTRQLLGLITYNRAQTAFELEAQARRCGKQCEDVQYDGAPLPACVESIEALWARHESLSKLANEAKTDLRRDMVDAANLDIKSEKLNREARRKNKQPKSFLNISSD